MSLLTSVNGGNETSPYYVENVGTDVDPIVPGGSLKLAGYAPLGAAYIRSASTTGSLHLGATPAVFDNIVCSAGPALTTVNTNLTCAAGLTVAGASVFSNSIDLNNQQIQNNLRFTQAFNVADGTNDVSPGTAQPSPMPFGSYAILVQITSPSTGVQVQPSCIGFWNGTIWSAGANGVGTTFPGGNVAVGIRPSADGTRLVMSNGSGSAITGFIYYTSLGEN